MPFDFWSMIVRIIHIVFVIFMILSPFSKSKDIVLIHVILVPFLFFHWVTNNDTCALTELEKFVCKKKVNKETFIGSILSPVYILDDCTSSKLTKVITLTLLCFSLQRI
jgi:hypothetical protein